MEQVSPNEWDICDTDDTWPEAIARFGTDTSKYVNDSSQHLVVLSDATDCAEKGKGEGTGAGTLGTGLNSGGAMWASINFTKPDECDQVVFHEFGHNISLRHSNLRFCSSTKSDSRTLLGAI